MKMYKTKALLIRDIERCTDWKILKKVLKYYIDEVSHELKRPRIVKNYKRYKGRSPRAMKLAKSLI